MAGNTGWSVNATWFKMARQPLLMLKGASAKDRAKGAKTSMRLALKLAFALRGSMAAVVVSAVLVAGQARPFPGPDVQQIYQRLLPQIGRRIDQNFDLGRGQMKGAAGPLVPRIGRPAYIAMASNHRYAL